jgi:hypothetical protein
MAFRVSFSKSWIGYRGSFLIFQIVRRKSVKWPWEDPHGEAGSLYLGSSHQGNLIGRRGYTVAKNSARITLGCKQRHHYMAGIYSQRIPPSWGPPLSNGSIRCLLLGRLCSEALLWDLAFQKIGLRKTSAKIPQSSSECSITRPLTFHI